MTDTDLDLWARACERVGVWNHEWKDGLCTFKTPIGDAECVVAMLEWLIPEQGNFLAFWRHGDLFNVEVKTIREHSSLPLALAAAVVAIPKEPDHAE